MADQNSQAGPAPAEGQVPAKEFSVPSVLRPIDIFRTRHGHANVTGLTFYQRHFTRPLPQALSSRAISSSVDTSGHGSSTGSDASVSDQKPEANDDSTVQDAGETASEATRNKPRKFSFLSRGAIASFMLLIIVILAILLPILITQLVDRDENPDDDGFGSRSPRHRTASIPSSPQSPDDPLGLSQSRPPVRLALLANFPDPSIHYDANTSTWYAFATNEAAGVLRNKPFNPFSVGLDPIANIQVATSTDLVTWTFQEAIPDALPTLAAWVRHQSLSTTRPHGLKHRRSSDGLEETDVAPGLHIDDSSVLLANVWAPDVVSHPNDNLFLLYYSAVSATDPKREHCIGAATATSLAGPYDPAATAIACPAAGAIDPVGIVDHDDANTIYVAYKVDGNSLGHGGECNNMVQPQVGTPIMLQRMLADGVSADPVFEPIQLLDRTDIDGPLIEAPSIVQVGSTWYLFYSSGCTRDPSYDVRYATASNITGPYTRHETPLLRTGDYGLTAPGSVSVRWAANNSIGRTSFNSSGTAAAESVSNGWKIALHARVGTRAGGVRAMFTAGLVFDEASGNVTLVDGVAGIS